MKVKDIYEEYLKNNRLQRVTERNYTSALKPVFKLIGNRHIETLTFADYEKIKSALKGRKISSINQSLTITRIIVAYGVNLGVVSQSPFTGARGIKGGIQYRDFLSIEERDEMLNRCINLKHRLLLEMAVFTGLRKSELFGLMWKDICFKKKTLTMCRTMERLGKIRDYGKTASALRVLPLPDRLIKRLKIVKRKDGFIFPYIASEFNNPTNEILRKYTTKKVCWHSLRNTFASALVQKNISLIKIASLLGHSKVSNTLYRYARIYNTSQLHDEINLIS